MKIFSRVLFKRENQRYVGVYVPPHVFEYLTLLCLVKGSSKASIVSNILIKWVQNEKAISSPTQLLKLISDRLKQQYKAQKKFSIDEFVEEATNELNKKGLTDVQIKYIIKKALNYDT